MRGGTRRAEAYIVDAVRTPVGRRGKGLSEVHPLDLAAAPLRELVERTGVDSSEYDEVILGRIDQLGPVSYTHLTLPTKA